jgi:hypothetical protein
MLRDDPWNVYTYDQGTGKFLFVWEWLECCTDGMILGPVPDEAQKSFTVTYEGDCSNMVGLAQGTRISMWNPRGAAYSALATNECSDPASQTASWIHYDVPMDQTCGTAHQGIQVHAYPCNEWDEDGDGAIDDDSGACAQFSGSSHVIAHPDWPHGPEAAAGNCGECTSQPHCGWHEATSTCRFCDDATNPVLLLHGGGTCGVCSGIIDAYSCMCEPGCGWAPHVDGTYGGTCISGTPDYPSVQSVFVVQWETKGCPAKSCPVDGPRSQCYRASYNEKHHFASSGAYQMEYAVLPATSYPAHHPQVTRGAQDGNAAPEACDQVPAADWWSRPNFDRDEFEDAESLPGAEVFFAFDFPMAFASNTGYEASESMVTFLVQGDDCETYLLVLVDKDHDGTGGFLQIDLSTTGVSGDPVAFQNDPTNRPDSFDSVVSNGAGGKLVSWAWQPDYNDGMVVGPLPMSADWSVTMNVITKETRGLDTFKIGTYDAERCDLGFVTASIQKATTKWGGLRFDAMECTGWCQRYEDCSSCTKDEQCQFYNGECVAADAYVYSYGCPRPANPPTTKVMERWAESYERESTIDGCDSASVIRLGLPASLDMSCPCSSRYRYWITVYDADNMQPVYTLEAVPPRLDYQYTFVDLCAEKEGEDWQLENGHEYHIYSYLCIAQGTLGRDDCSPVQIETITTNMKPPPPSPPPPSS